MIPTYACTPGTLVDIIHSVGFAEEPAQKRTETNLHFRRENPKNPPSHFISLHSSGYRSYSKQWRMLLWIKKISHPLKTHHKQLRVPGISILLQSYCKHTCMPGSRTKYELMSDTIQYRPILVRVLIVLPYNKCTNSLFVFHAAVLGIFHGIFQREFTGLGTIS